MDSDVRPWPEVISRALAQVVPYVGDSLVTVLDQMFLRRRLAAQSIAREIVEDVGAGPLGHRLAADPEGEALFVRGLDVAIRTGLQAKRRLLAKVIAQAVLDDARVDPALLYVMVLQDLEAPHLRALERLRRVEEAVIKDVSLDDQVASRRIGDAWSMEPTAIQAALSRTGCVEAAGVFLLAHGRDFKLVTGFGHDLLNHLRECDQENQLLQR